MSKDEGVPFSSSSLVVVGLILKVLIRCAIPYIVSAVYGSVKNRV
jgi:hypothetical protein